MQIEKICRIDNIRLEDVKVLMFREGRKRKSVLQRNGSCEKAV